MRSTIGKIIGWSAIGSAVLVTLGCWAAFNLSGPAGNQFAGSTGTRLALYGRLAGLLCALAFLFLLLSMGKGRLLERCFAKVNLARWHRRLGLATLGLLIVHFVLIFAGRAQLYDENFLTLLRQFALTPGWGMVTAAGALLLLGVWIFCVLFVRRKMSFPAWKKTHYAVYAVVVLLFFHQVNYGVDLANHAAFRYFWIAIFALTLLDAALWRIRLTFFTTKKG